MTRQNSSVPGLLREITAPAMAPVFQWFAQISPGICLTVGLAAIAYLLRTLPGFNLFSPLILAIMLGMLVRNTVGMSYPCQPGVSFALKRILRLAIILLGLQLSLVQVMAIGLNGLALIAFTLISTFGFTCWMGKQLGVRENLTYLIASGTSICGASAVIATSAATKGSDEDTAYAVAIVTVFGTLSMLLYPLSLTLLNLTPEAFGIWCGASIHEVAQALAAAFQASSTSGELASIAKLSRVLWLAPTVLFVGFLTSSSNRSGTQLKPRSIAIPWFVGYFVLLILLNSLNVFPASLKSTTGQINQFLLTIAMAAMGLETKLKHMKQTGLKPLYLGALSWLFISVLSYGLIQAFY
jgi:uncharacterized integral membrane protein (TIGR00698 family)